MSSPTGVRVVEAPAAVAALRRVLLLSEDRVGHYPEFAGFFERCFALAQAPLARPGYLQAPSGAIYELVFVGRSGQPFPCGVEVNALVEALEPLDDALADRDLWAILRWMVEGVGAPWSVDTLDATGRLYRIPAAGKA